jgi:hypothetical protein
MYHYYVYGIESRRGIGTLDSGVDLEALGLVVLVLVAVMLVLVVVCLKETNNDTTNLKPLLFKI